MHNKLYYSSYINYVLKYIYVGFKEIVEKAYMDEYVVN